MDKSSLETTQSANSDQGQPGSVLRLLVSSKLLLPFAFLVVALLGSVVAVLLAFTGVWDQQRLLGLLLLLSFFVLLVTLVAAIRLRSQLLLPLIRLEQSVAAVCQGKPLSSLPFENVGALGTLVRDFDELSGELTEIYEGLEQQVDLQTRRLTHQAATLKILYDVAASINQTGDLDQMLIHFLTLLRDLSKARAVSVYLQGDKERLRLIGSIGLDGQLVTGREQLPLPLCECGQTLSLGDVLCPRDPVRCSEKIGRKMYGDDEIECVQVPIEYQGDRFGFYNLYLDKAATHSREGLRELIMAIGSHLGMAVARRRMDEMVRRDSIIEERTTLAHELHDSLAQTLTSLRLQLRTFQGALEKGDISQQARSELSRIGDGLDEAHSELRELLSSFLAPAGRQEFEPELKRLTRQFRRQTGIPTFFQRDCPRIDLTTGEEKQILRIVQECLANIRKHAGAHNVRILFTCLDDGEYRLLVEDDGVGFKPSTSPKDLGEQIGLSIMQERAQRLGGELTIESVPGEGTRVELVYNVQNRKLDDERLIETP